jgi:hypothetical protein
MVEKRSAIGLDATGADVDDTKREIARWTDRRDARLART